MAEIFGGKWIFGLGIPQVGETTAKEVSRLFKHFDSLANSELLSDIAKRGAAVSWKISNPISSKFEEIDAVEKQLRKVKLKERGHAGHKAFQERVPISEYLMVEVIISS